MSPFGGGLKIAGQHLPRRYRLLLSAVIFITGPTTAFAQSSDDQELAAIKAEMRMLEGRLQAIEERRHTKTSSQTTHPRATKAAFAPRKATAGFETPHIGEALSPHPTGVMPISTAGLPQASIPATPPPPPLTRHRRRCSSGWEPSIMKPIGHPST